MELVYSQLKVPECYESIPRIESLRMIVSDIKALQAATGGAVYPNNWIGMEEAGRLFTYAVKIGAFAGEKWRRWRMLVTRELDRGGQGCFQNVLLNAHTFLSDVKLGIAAAAGINPPTPLPKATSMEFAALCRFAIDLIEREIDVTPKDRSSSPTLKARTRQRADKGDWAVLIARIPETIPINTQADVARYLDKSPSAVCRALEKPIVRKAFQRRFPDVPIDDEHPIKHQKSSRIASSRRREDVALDD